MQDSQSGEEMRARRQSSDKSQRSEADAFKGKPLPKKKRKARLSWKVQKNQLEQMDIEDLKNYIADTEY